MTDTLKDARDDAQRKFLRSEKSVNSILSKEDVPSDLLQQRYQDIKALWTQLQVHHDTYVLKSLRGAEPSEIEAADKVIDEIAERFTELELSVFRKMRNEKQCISNISAPQKHFIKLEHLKFRKFDGNIRNYPRFKSDLEKYIAPMCDPIHMPHLIKSYLSESVCRDVENLDSASEIWERLDQKYGARHKLIECILQEIKHLSTEDNDDSAILAMINTVESAHRDLARIHEEAEMENSTILSIIETQMPVRMSNEWTSIASKLHGPQQKFSKLLPFLSQWKLRVEYTSSNMRRVENVANSPKKDKCWLHKDCDGDVHPIWRCRLFQSLSVEERRKLTKANKACTSCLQIGHSSDTCSRRFRCQEAACTEYHNQLLH